MPTKVKVVEEVNENGVLVKPKKIQGLATHACGCLARQAICIIHDDWRKVPKDDKDYIGIIVLSGLEFPEEPSSKSRSGS